MISRSCFTTSPIVRFLPTAPDWAGAVGLLIASVGILLGFALPNTGGKLVYTFDDAYIHLALAENIARGHYGINWGEASAPSSSPLWPFFLAPFCWLGLEEPVPLTINLVSAVAVVAAFSRTVASLLDGFRPLARHALTTWLVGLLVVATNLVPSVFSGLEHTVQLACVTSIVGGMTTLVRTGNLPRWAAAALVVAPLVRYENLAVCAPALVALALTWHLRQALALGTVMLLLLGSYSAFLVVLGLDPLPSSVLLKSLLLRADRAPLTWLDELTRSLTTVQGQRLAVAALFFASVAWVRRADRPSCVLPLFASSIALLHLAAGQLDWYGRYGAYAWLACLLVLLTLSGTRLTTWLRARPIWVGMALSVSVLLLHRRELNNVWEVPLASRNIYEQQYQMHRFVTERYRAPVAVNDIGWVGYRNEAYVLDLWGLASPSVQTARMSGDAQWMSVLARSHGVKLVMIYTHWFDKLPSSWRAIATLHLGHRPVTAAGDTVTFYATDPSATQGLGELLAKFGRTLPPGVRLALSE